MFNEPHSLHLYCKLLIVDLQSECEEFIDAGLAVNQREAIGFEDCLCTARANDLRDLDDLGINLITNVIDQPQRHTVLIVEQAGIAEETELVARANDAILNHRAPLVLVANEALELDETGEAGCGERVALGVAHGVKCYHTRERLSTLRQVEQAESFVDFFGDCA